MFAHKYALTSEKNGPVTINAKEFSQGYIGSYVG